MSELINELSYESILNARKAFRKAGSTHSDDFNIFDFPGHKFFKVLFYFWNDPNNDNIEESGGLLAPTWTLGVKDNFWQYDSAWAYLKNNAEEERADKLEKFVSLLSNISTYSPWYFKSISGVDSALERKSVTDNQMKFEDNRQQISITCMPDAFDNRIGTLLDLYRDIVWSWQTKREIVPSNLRKFDMGLYIYESPIKGLHKHFDNYAIMNQGNSNQYQTSYKYIEFHNCEIDYSSAKSGYATLTNEEGFNPEYTINIFFDDCYEYRYNELMMRTIGDMVVWDSVKTIFDEHGSSTLTGDNVAQGTLNSKLNNTAYNKNHQIDSNARLTPYAERFDNDKSEFDLQHLDGFPQPYKDKGFLENALSQLVMPGVDYISSKLKSAFLGNIFGYSLSKFGSQLQDLARGNVIGAVDAGIDYANKAKSTHHEMTKNIFHGLYSKHLDVNDIPTATVKVDKNKVTSLGNLNKGKSAVNNL